MEAEQLARMTATLVHRGPDDEGHFIEGGVGLGMRRLAIIDVAGGRQPVRNEDGTVVVVLNGEIYNFRELMAGLIARGHTLRTRSDTECIAHLYEERGLDFPLALRGMFAVALYDRSRRRLVLARDRLGKKPLYYAETAGQLLFGSEIKAIHAAAPELRAPDERLIHPFFRFGFVPEPETLFRGIRTVPPGHLLVADTEGCALRRYWDLEPAAERVQEPLAALDARLAEAVRIRTESEVPIGAFLSGGLDSSLIVSYLSRISTTPVNTFTVNFEEEAFGEGADAARVAAHCGTAHRVLTLRPDDIRDEFFDTVDAITRHTDQPFGDSSSFPTWHICRRAREEVTVILAGDGADEVFGGYTIYQGLRFARLYRRIPAPLRRRVIEAAVRAWAASRPPGPRRWRANHWLKRIEDSDVPLRPMLARKFSLSPRTRLDALVPGARERLGEAELSGEAWIDLGRSTDPFDQVVYATTRMLMVNDMLVKIDRMSMAHSLEIRSPYLDHEVVELAAQIPPERKLRGWETKAILREIAATRLPRANARKKKQGFGVPIPLWFRGPLWTGLRERLLDSPAVRRHLDRSEVVRLLDTHRDGTEDNAQILWCLLVFEAWHRHHVETPA